MDIFEGGLCWTLYKQYEADFLHFLEYVPYTEENAIVYSPKLVAMLLQTCGYIDTVFKEMAKYRKFENDPTCREIVENPNEFNIIKAINAFESRYRLSSNNGADLLAKLGWIQPKQYETLHPFQSFGDNESPQWWKDYNQVKHEWSTSIRKANMSNVLNALAGAFLLNAVHYPSLKLLWKSKDLILMNRGGPSSDAAVQRILNEDQEYVNGCIEEAFSNREPLKWAHSIETPMFIYKHRGRFAAIQE